MGRGCGGPCVILRLILLIFCTFLGMIPIDTVFVAFVIVVDGVVNSVDFYLVR